MNKLFFILFLFISCLKSEDNLKTKLYGRELWDSLEITDYSMIQQMSCYCSPQEIIFPKKIIVKNDKIKTIDGELINKFDWHISFKTVEELFDFIEYKIDKNPEEHIVIYNEKYGYPEEIYFDMSFLIADEEIGYYITNFKIDQ